MKIFLFGGAESHDGHADVVTLFHLIQEAIRETGSKELLLVPFARTIASEPEWEGDRFNRHIHIEGLKLLNASNPEDIQEAQHPIILISGGDKGLNLMQHIIQDPQLLKFIQEADVIIGESSGAKILGEWQRVTEGKTSTLMPGLGIIADTIIEGHYGEKKREKLLEQELRETGMAYGIGVDSASGIHFDLQEFPQKYEIIGKGKVEVKTNPEGKIL